MEFDEWGFPRPVTFETESQRRPIRPQVTAGRLFLILLAILMAGAAGLAVHLAEQEGGIDNLLGRLIPRRVQANRAQMLYHRILRNMQAGQFEKALVDAEKLAVMFPPVGHRLRGDILGHLHRYQESIEAYTIVIKLDPAQAMAYNNRAYNRALARIDIDLAMEDVEHALAIEGNNSAYIDTRGYLYYLQGNMKLALADFNSILDRQPNGMDAPAETYGEIYFHRGLVYRKLNEQKLAEQDFEAARQHGYVIKDYPQPIEAEIKA